jgi:5-methyltetrahydrofolate--homocysteine methyltransferase
MMNEEIIELLKENVIQGRRDKNDEGIMDGMLGMPGAKELTEAAIRAGIPPKRIIAEGLTAGMNLVADKYQAKEYFTSDMLASLEATGIAMEILEPHLAESGISSEGKIVLATVKGDLHDIGKSIVSLSLRGAGYQVTDLGNDVAPERIVAAVRQENPDFLALSALGMMGETIDSLKEAGLRDKVKVLVGGAAVSQDFADEIGADAYGANGFHALRLVEELRGQRKGERNDGEERL